MFTGHINKTLIKALFGIILLSINACGSHEDDKKTINPGDKAKILYNAQLNYEKAIFDDFTDGVNFDRWIIGNGAWGEKNGGIIPDNVSYTDDGVLLLTGNGKYYAKEEVKGVGERKDGSKTGAGLISKFQTGPGHYEIRMKPLARKGACTAFWTFNNVIVPGEESDNHEIDIELPGGKSTGNISFRNVLNTNYTKESLNESQDVVVNDVTQGKTVYLNDGKFHTFGFDWYTNPTAVVYFVDDIVTAVSTDPDFVPTYKTRLWFGNWFPSATGFVGEANFEKDYMHVDWVKYIPFDSNQPYVDIDAGVTVNSALKIQYPTSPVSLPTVNYISNGDFEYIYKKDEQNGYGWDFAKMPGEDKEVSEVSFVGKDMSHDGSACVNVIDGGVLSTEIDSIYDNFKFDLDFDYVSKGLKTKMEIRYFDLADTPFESKTYDLSSEDWTHFHEIITAPANTNAIVIRFYDLNRAADLKIDEVSLKRIYGES